jgi:O-antigen/teichoic acid export membrane protein
MLNFAVCRSRERFAPEATGQTVQALIALVIVVAALRAGYGMLALGWAAIVATGVELILSTAFALRFVRFAVSFRGVAATLRAALPFATTNAGAVALAQLDVIVLSIVAVPLEVGHYAAASRLLLGGSYFVILASDVVVPSATLRWVTGNRERFQRRSATALRLMMFAAVPVALVLVVSAPLLVRIVYGPAFAPVAVLLQLGSAFAALKLWTTPLQAMLTVTGRQRARAISVGCGLAVTGALILMLGARRARPVRSSRSRAAKRRRSPSRTCSARDARADIAIVVTGIVAAPAPDAGRRQQPSTRR